jgi:hypothetical protein
MDGFYAAYLTGRGGNTVMLFAIKGNEVVGVDGGGLTYDGNIEAAANGGFTMHIKYVIAPGTSLITGVGTVAAPTPVALVVNLPSNFADRVIVSVQTPFGPVNAKISKLREFDFKSTEQ